MLIIKPSSLGDIVHALPVLAGLREAYPRGYIAWLVSESFAPLLEGHPLLDEVIVFDRRRYGKLLRSGRILAGFLRFLRDLRRRRFDLVIDLQGLFRSGFLAFVSGASRRIGFASARECAAVFYTQRVACPADARHAVDRNLCVLGGLDVQVGRPEFPLGLRPEELEVARTLLDRSAGRSVGAFTAVIPGARWEAKRWRAYRLATLIERMHAEGLPRCALLGSSADREFADSVLAACRVPVIDLVGRTDLRELVALLELSDLVVGHDTGPLHIAAALGKPVVGIFGPTDPAATGPYAASAGVVSAAVECTPCRLRTCDHHSCMERLGVEAVLAQVREIGGAIPVLRRSAGREAGAGVGGRQDR